MLFNKIDKKQEELRSNFYKTFNTVNGKEVLIYLQLLKNKSLPDSCTSGQLYYQEGMRSIIKLIENYSK